MSTDWIPGAGVGIVGSTVAWIMAWRVSSARMEGKDTAEHLEFNKNMAALRQDLRDLKDDLKSGIGEIRGLADASARLQSSQNVVNSVTAKMLQDVTDKLDKHEALLSDHAATLRLLAEILANKRIVDIG